MEPKKLKKLVLKKEPIANLNHIEMNQMKGGGSSAKCYDYIVKSIELTWQIYSDIAKEKSWFPYDCGGDGGPISKNWDEGQCILDPIYCYP